MEKFLENLAKSEKNLNLVEHLIYTTYPLIQDKNILIKSLNELKKAQINLINSVLQFEYFNRKINLYKSSHKNYLVFKKKCAKKYGLSEKEISKISQTLEITLQEKKSLMDIKREEKLFIITPNSKVISINFSKIKDLTSTTKQILVKIKKQIKKEYWRKV